MNIEMMLRDSDSTICLLSTERQDQRHEPIPGSQEDTLGIEAAGAATLVPIIPACRSIGIPQPDDGIDFLTEIQQAFAEAEEFTLQSSSAVEFDPSMNTRQKPGTLVDTHDIEVPSSKQGNPSFSVPRFASLDLIAPFYPEADPHHPRAQTFRTWHTRRDIVLYTCCLIAILVFVLNLVTLLLGRRHFTGGRVFYGNCSTSSRLSTLIHIAINILSSLLLFASNNCLQMLVAPTRKEIDQAHKEKRWLDIGKLSIRNLLHIDRKRLVVSLILVLSSIPLHFLYNSAFFTTIPVNAYTWAIVTPEFLTGTPFNITATNDTLTERAARTVQWLPPWSDDVVSGKVGTPGDVTNSSWHIEETLLAWRTRSLNDTTYTKLEPLECLEAYVTQFGNACLFVLNLGVLMLGFALQELKLDTGSLKYVSKLGFGSLDQYEILDWSFLSYDPGQRSFYSHILFANIWQVAVSIVYVQCQALLSSLLVADEWGRFALSKKTARVSHPIGLQRSTYFISLPWKYGGTLLGVMILLHWLISQSVFLIQIESFSSDGTVYTPWNQSADGYSILPIICAIVVGLSLIFALAMCGLRRLSTDIPLASTCSAAISAACHAPEEDKQTYLFPIRWGVVKEKDGVGHCCFTTARDVEAPIEGLLYE
ncbi:hypothetical protein N7520_003839 [Penicillium odoratum]|uniref:uncharacterized protein n=1 Tax=Penicillium odoratum TaxID=1167516 RepID=UPI002548D3BB|nr:uncharacterized protein N7520_003839 [Penicillium odoratum]KAJ5769280.1 hypothetical protein N7520_003839 [Penicillium odoratum]